MPRNRIRTVGELLSAATFLVAAIAGTTSAAAAYAASDQPKPTVLNEIGQLKAAFNKDVGSTRLILLLSPT